MEQKRTPLASRLFAHSLLDVKDEGEDRYERCYSSLSQLVAGKGEKELNDALNIAVSKDAKSHEDICIGLMVVILTEQENAAKHYRYLTFVARDGMHCILNELNRLVLEKYLKLKEDVRKQMIWFTKEMIKNQVQNVDGLCWNLMRQIGGGDLSQKNLWLADSMMDIYTENRSWLEKYQFLLASVVYTYLRIIEDHAHANLSLLRMKEVTFVVSIIRDRFSDVLIIGRDLVRLLQNIARIPEIEQLWHEILYNPTALAPSFTGLVQIMESRTSRRFLQSRITPDMEKKLVFLTSQVRFGSHKRYQEWFQRTYLSTLESQSLRCDLIRFIVGVIHPTNELLCSDIIPRWAVIGWLLTTCTNPVAASNAKLALFYDWLFFDAEKDNIMNIEPAILVMHHSMRPHPAITATLLDFLCRIIHNFWPAETDKVRAGIYSSLRQIVDKKVLPSLSPLFDNQRLDRELRAMLKERFGVFLSREEEERRLEGGLEPEPGGPTFSSDEDEEDEDRDEVMPILAEEKRDEPVVGLAAVPAQPRPPESPGLAAPGAWLSAVAAPPPLPPAVAVETAAAVPPAAERRVTVNHVNSNGEGSGDAEREELDREILERMDQLKEETNCERRCEAMDQLVHLLISEQVEGEEARQVAEKLSEILRDQFEGKIFPDNPTPESIEDSVGQPLFVIFRTLCEINEIDPNRQPVLSVLAELYGLQPRLGYYLLYYLKSYNKLDSKSKSLIYKDLCEAIDGNNSLDICLVNDMRQCQEDDVNLFVYLVPDVYTNFQKAAIGNVDLLYLVVSCVDGRQIETLVCHIIAKDFIMFKKDSFQPVISISLSWETFEQYALWQLLLGHELPVDCILPLIPKLSFEENAEALTHIMLLLRREKPSAELIKHLMSREPNPKDRFVTSMLSCWLGQQYEDAKKLGDLIGSQLCKQASPAGVKRKRTINLNKSSNSLGALAEMTLGHLDLLRQTCKNYDLFNMRSIQQSLQTVRSMCTDSQKKKFSDLFALADSESEEDSAQQKVRSSSSSKGKQTKSPHKLPKKSAAGSTAGGSGAGGGSLRNSESSGESSETDDDVGTSSLNNKPGSGNKGRGSGASSAKPRKRGVISKVSYKEFGSSEASSDDEELKKTPKKKKQRVSSDSE